MLLRGEDFDAFGGLSNNFWGWGREDDELYGRLNSSSVNIVRSYDVVEITTGKKTFKHLHDADERPRDYSKVGKQYEAGWKRDTETGLASSEHEIVKLTLRNVAGFEWVDPGLPGSARVVPG